MVTNLYGGDAANSKQIECGDFMTTSILNEALKEVLPEAYISKQRINVLLTYTQLMQIRPDREELFAMIYFLPINTYQCNYKVQEAIISCGSKVVKIYTSKE